MVEKWTVSVTKAADTVPHFLALWNVVYMAKNVYREKKFKQENPLTGSNGFYKTMCIGLKKEENMYKQLNTEYIV